MPLASCVGDKSSPASQLTRFLGGDCGASRFIPQLRVVEAPDIEEAGGDHAVVVADRLVVAIATY
jgi:hypothetical protein